MVRRIWHGWTTPQNADAYESLLKKEIFVSIGARRIEGYRGIDLYRRDIGDEVEFVTLMKFDSWDAVKSFAGVDYERSVVPEEARKLLSRFDERSQHYDIKAELKV